MTLRGEVLTERREERGLTLQQAANATRIRIEHLNALEAGAPERIPAEVYARGYLRAYARYLGLDPEPLLADLGSIPIDVRRNLGLGRIAGRPRVVINGPAVAAAGLLVLAGAFGAYAWRQIDSEQRLAAPTPPPVAQLPAVSPPTTPVPTPSPQPRPLVVGVTVQLDTWLDVTVDGKSQYSDSGRILPAGSTVYFTGLDVKITSGKASTTFVSIDGRDIGPLGAGVATKEFTAQTSP